MPQTDFTHKPTTISTSFSKEAALADSYMLLIFFKRLNINRIFNFMSGILFFNF